MFHGLQEMVRIIEEEKLPHGKVRCDCCLSLLEYDNTDVTIEPDVRSVFPLISYNGFIICPKCGNYVMV